MNLERLKVMSGQIHCSKLGSSSSRSDSGVQHSLSALHSSPGGRHRIGNSIAAAPSKPTRTSKLRPQSGVSTVAQHTALQAHAVPLN